MVAVPLFSSCDPTDGLRLDENGNHMDETENPEDQMIPGNDIVMKVGNISFTVKLYDNATSKAFAELLPLTLRMNELNGNEKYSNLAQHLPSDAYAPGRINAGDLMLFGTNCLVLFYESFSTGYSYTRIGKVAEGDELEKALGSGSVTIIFEQG